MWIFKKNAGVEEENCRDSGRNTHKTVAHFALSPSLIYVDLLPICMQI